MDSLELLETMVSGLMHASLASWLQSTRTSAAVRDPIYPEVAYIREYLTFDEVTRYLNSPTTSVPSTDLSGPVADSRRNGANSALSLAWACPYDIPRYKLEPGPLPCSC